MRPDEYDVSGTGVGVVNADAVLGPERVRPGDVLLAMGASGLHSNGYSLVRHVLLERAGLALDATPAQLGGRTLGDELLEPTRIYALDCLALSAEVGAHAFAHVTGGGLAGNLARVLPAGALAVVDRAGWAPPPIFGLVAGLGAVSREQMELTFNLGVGMVAVVPGERSAAALQLLADRGVPAWLLGDIRTSHATFTEGESAGRVEMTSNYAGNGYFPG